MALFFIKGRGFKVIDCNKNWGKYCSIIDMQYETSTSVKRNDDYFEINIGIYARNPFEGMPFSAEDFDKLKEYINRTVIKYGIDPIADIENGYINY